MKYRKPSALACATLLTATLGLNGCGGSPESAAERARLHLTSSEAYRQQGQYRAAMIEARNAIKQAPDDSTAYLLLAAIYNDLGDAERAAELLHRTPAGSEPDTELELAAAYLQQGKFRSAQETLTAIQDSALATRPVRWQLLHARALAGGGAADQARQIYQHLIDSDPERHQARLELARLELVGGHTEAAQAALEPIPDGAPQFSEAQQLMAIIAYRAGELESAERLLTDALAALPPSDVITPLKARILRQLSETLTQLGRPSEALVYNRLLAEAVPGMQERRQKFSQALELYRTGNLDDAEKLLTELYEVNPENNQSGLLLGLLHYQRGEYAAAGELFKQHVDPETNSPQLIEAAAISQLRQSRSQEALELLQQALKDHPDDASLLSIYGMTALRDPSRREDGALALQKALALQPRRSQLRLPLANYYLQIGKPEQAQAQLQTAAMDSPTDSRVQSAYVTYLVAQGQLEMAEGAAQRFMEASEQSVDAQVLLGQVQAYGGDYAAAERSFNAALDLDPDNVAANEGLAQLSLRQRQWANAVGYFHNAVQLAPQSERAYKGLLTAYEAQGDRAGGEQALRQLSQYQDHIAVAQAVLAEYHLRHDQLAAASKAAGRALEYGREIPYVQRTAASVYRFEARAAQDEGDGDRARDLLMTAIELAPANLGALSDLVVVELAAGHRQEAERIIDRIEKQPGGTTPAALMTAYAHQQSGDMESALQTLHTAWSQHPDPVVADRLYQLLTQQGRDEEARMLAVDWSQRHARDPRPLIHLAAAAQANRNPRDAQRYYEQALQLTPDNPLLLNNLAWLYYERGNPRAVVLARKASELAPDNADILDTYGWVLVQSGEREQGIELLERAAAIAPASEEIARHLQAARNAP